MSPANISARIRRPAMAWLTTAAMLGGSVAAALPPAPLVAAAAPTPAPQCDLSPNGSGVQHVIYIQFDNTHFTRDNPNVPSDLEQMPHLLNFLTDNGALLSNHHTPLIAHTATDILTSLTGVYGDRHGQPVSNSYRYFNPDGTSNGASSFAYWTDPVAAFGSAPATDTTPTMIAPNGGIAPAPWVPFTRAGCNVGGVATANIELENTGLDITKVFGANSPQAAEAKANPDQASADFVGIAIHCASGAEQCASANGGQPDQLPNEPGGYSGFNGLFGHTYVAPQISPNGPLTDLNGKPIAGFPGFGEVTPAVTLGYVAAMQEHGVPVTYSYIRDAHENFANGNAYGPGEAGYVANLKAYDQAFGTFFDRLAHDGITKDNTLFVVTADENDHFAGGKPTPTGCDGINTPCTYPDIGELATNLTGLLATEKNVTTPFTVHADSAPTIYITGRPAPDAPVTRDFERALAGLTVTNLHTGANEKLANYLADPVEMKLLHMVTADPARTPTVTMFAKPDYYVSTGAPNCSSPCVSVGPSYAWIHGDLSPDINVTWLGLVGPGVRKVGVDHAVWSDHTDIRPTMLFILGLKDDYAHQGRVLLEVLGRAPSGVDRGTYIRLAEVYKQVNAPVGQLGLASLEVSTRALASNDWHDATYGRLERQLQTIAEQQADLAQQMSGALESAAFGGATIQPGQAGRLIGQGQGLIKRTEALAASQ